MEANQRLQDPQHDAHKVFAALKQIITVRRATSAFAPQAEQACLEVDQRLFCVKRHNKDTGSHILCLFNVSNETVTLEPNRVGLSSEKHYQDIISGKQTSRIVLSPYQVSWFTLA